MISFDADLATAGDDADPVPLLRGLGEAYHPVRPVQDERVRLLLAALADLDPDTDALISELEMREGESFAIAGLLQDVDDRLCVGCGDQDAVYARRDACRRRAR